MVTFTSAKKAAAPGLLLLFSIFLFTFQGCKKKRSEMANMLFKKTHNEVFKEFTTEGFQEVFKKVLEEKKFKLTNQIFINSYYLKNEYNPELLTGHLFNKDLLIPVTYYKCANEHGLDPGMFEPEKISALLLKFETKNGIKTIDEAYRDMAELEITSTNSLINYSNVLQYGVTNPKKIFQRYFMGTKRPDSVWMAHIFNINNIRGYLDSIQPKSPQYIALQKALINGTPLTGKSQEESKRILIVNLERLRWKNKPSENKYVIVNIPDYMLNVVDSGRSVLKMKVCVGEGRNRDNANTIMAYNDTAKEDKPFAHETPQLNSLIHSVEVNPIWNIPRSIANKEIIIEAAKDRFYLSNKNIEVYKNDKLVDNAEDIDWTTITKENLPYEFKQSPGADNSLGKIKFLFNNKSSVYLHDTPVKGAFYKKMRSVSHGCVRLDNPQGLALSLFGEGVKYQTISTDMNEDNPTPTTIYLPKKVPVYVTYVTCWADENGVLQSRQDVYGLDIVLYDHLMRNCHPAVNLN